MGKEENNATWQIRLPKSLRDDFRQICEDKALNSSEIMRRLLVEWVDANKKIVVVSKNGKDIT